MYFTKVFYSSLDSHERMIFWLLSKIPQEILQIKGENKIEVAFDELLTNIYEHGYKTNPCPIFLKVSLNNSGVFFEIRDMGPQFNPLNHQKKIMTEQMPVGGVGISLLKAVFENLSYEYEKGLNLIKFGL